VSIDILTMRRFEPNDKAIEIALPVLAVECEATPPIDNYLDAYEETVLKLVKMNLSANGISKTMNTPESLIEEILNCLEDKEFVRKETGKPWTLTEDGGKYLNGETADRASRSSIYGYMFVNAVKRDYLPYFYQGDINQISLFRGEMLPERLTLNGSELDTFKEIHIKRTKLRDAYLCFFKTDKTSRKYNEGDISLEEAIDQTEDLFEGINDFDEATEEETLPASAAQSDNTLQRKMFIRPLNTPHKKLYLRMRIIIDPRFPGGYIAESPFLMNGIDNNYYLSQIQWMDASGSIFIGNEKLDDYLLREIRKISPPFKNSEKDFDVFVIEKLPLLKIYKHRFSQIYDDLARIYPLMQKENGSSSGDSIEQENIVSNISRRVVERLFDKFFAEIPQDVLRSTATRAKDDLYHYRESAFIKNITRNTYLNPDRISWSCYYIKNAAGRMSTTHGNSIVEKFINAVILHYYYGSKEVGQFLTVQNIQYLYELTDHLNGIRKLVSHNTEAKFTNKDYSFYISHVFELVNSLLTAFSEDLV